MSLFLPASVVDVQPSYANGFARSQGESANPNLWQRLMGLWVPPLGVTGLKLFGQSRFSNDGTLISMDATNWVVSSKGWALDLDGVGDYVNIAHDVRLETGTGPITLVAWAAVGTQDAAKTALLSKFGTGASRGYWLQIIDSKIDFAAGGSSDNVVRSSFNIDDGVMRCYVGVRENTGANGCKLYIDGVFNAQGTITGTNTSGVSLRLGNFFDIGSREFLGTIAGVAIYSRAVTTSEIQHLSVDLLAPLRLRARNIFPAAVAPGGLSIPIAMHHYRQLRNAG